MAQDACYKLEDKQAYRFLAVVTVCLAIIYTYFFMIAQDELGRDNMYAAYLVLVPVLLLVDSWFDSGNILYKVFGVAGVIYLFFLGTRGPLLCVIMFCGLTLLKKFGSIKAGIIQNRHTSIV